MEDKKISEQESLRIITEMISKVKHSFHENGSSSILWGSVIAVCGLVSFVQINWGVSIGFDIWMLTLAAFIPQIFISIRERRERRVTSHTEAALNAVWIIYAISIFGLVFYFNTVPGVSDRLTAGEGVKIMITTADGQTKPYHYIIPSAGSLLLLLYAIPTLATGWVHRFQPMIVAGILCYVFFAVSCFTPVAYDMLLNGLAGIFNWLIPGLILRQRFNREKKRAHV